MAVLAQIFKIEKWYLFIFSQKYQNIANKQKINFEILVQTALIMGGFLRSLKITPKSALLSLTIL